jgi:hypothetical protein
MTTPRRIDPGTLPVERWKNGGGTTVEIARGPAQPGCETPPDTFDWRVSVARIEADGPFSAYPGIDRVITLLAGPGVALQAPADADRPAFSHRLDRPGEPFAFAGEAAVQARCLGGPSLDVNVMTRRAVLRATVTVHRAACDLAPHSHGLVLAGTGAWTLAGQALSPGQALVWQGEPWGGPLAPDAANDATAFLLAVHWEATTASPGR